MTVRKTENRIPADFQPSELGEASVTADGRAALISFVTTPLVVGRENVYVASCRRDAGASAVSFQWSVRERGRRRSRPQAMVVLLCADSRGQVGLVVGSRRERRQVKLSVDQEVVELMPVEALISDAQNRLAQAFNRMSPAS